MEEFLAAFQSISFVPAPPRRGREETAAPGTEPCGRPEVSPEEEDLPDLLVSGMCIIHPRFGSNEMEGRHLPSTLSNDNSSQ